MIRLGIRPDGQEDDISQEAWLLWYKSIPNGPGGRLTCRRALALAFRQYMRKLGFYRWFVTTPDSVRHGPYSRKHDAFVAVEKMGYARKECVVTTVSVFKQLSPTIPARPATILASLEEVNQCNDATCTLVKMLAAGHSSAEVAEHLEVSRPYVSKLLSNVRDTLGSDYLTPETTTQTQPLTSSIAPLACGPHQRNVADGIVRLTSDSQGTLFAGPYALNGSACYHPAQRVQVEDFPPITRPVRVKIRTIRPARPARPDAVRWEEYLSCFGIRSAQPGRISTTLVSYVSRMRSRIITTLSV